MSDSEDTSGPDAADQTLQPLEVSQPLDVDTSAVDDQNASALIEPLLEGDARLLADPGGLDPDGLEAVADDAALAQVRASANEYADLGWRQVGTPVTDGARVQKVDESATPPRAVVDVCLDYEDVDVVDDAGNSMVDPSAPTRVLTTFVLERRADVWIVTERTFPLEVEC